MFKIKFEIDSQRLCTLTVQGTLSQSRGSEFMFSLCRALSLNLVVVSSCSHCAGHSSSQSCGSEFMFCPTGVKLH